MCLNYSEVIFVTNTVIEINKYVQIWILFVVFTTQILLKQEVYICFQNSSVLFYRPTFIFASDLTWNFLYFRKKKQNIITILNQDDKNKSITDSARFFVTHFITLLDFLRIFYVTLSIAGLRRSYCITLKSSSVLESLGTTDNALVGPVTSSHLMPKNDNSF